MGYAIMQIKDDNGDYIDWDGALVPGPDGTLGSVVIKKVLEEHVSRAQGVEVPVPANSEAVVASHSVPIGEVHKVFGYGLSADGSNVDYFAVHVAGVAKAKVYTGTYAGGQLDDYILIDNTGGVAAVAVDLVAHNASGLSGAEASGFILVEDVTDSQAGS